MMIATLIEKLQEDISWLGYNETEREIVKHIERTITLLKEQEAVEPTVSGAEEHDGLSSWWYQCGKCKKPIDYGDKFCRHCGKAVKWE